MAEECRNGKQTNKQTDEFISFLDTRTQTSGEKRAGKTERIEKSSSQGGHMSSDAWAN